MEFLFGVIVGLVGGLLIYRYFLDKPEIENNYHDKIKIKQKKGIFRNWINRRKNNELDKQDKK